MPHVPVGFSPGHPPQRKVNCPTPAATRSHGPVHRSACSSSGEPGVSVLGTVCQPVVLDCMFQSNTITVPALDAVYRLRVRSSTQCCRRHAKRVGAARGIRRGVPPTVWSRPGVWRAARLVAQTSWEHCCGVCGCCLGVIAAHVDDCLDEMSRWIGRRRVVRGPQCQVRPGPGQVLQISGVACGPLLCR